MLGHEHLTTSKKKARRRPSRIVLAASGILVGLAIPVTASATAAVDLPLPRTHRTGTENLSRTTAADTVVLGGYGGANPFECRIQRVGTGVDFPRPDADPFCVEYDKTRQNLTDLGLVDFLMNEPARVAVASNKCFYYQRDHWHSSVDQHWEQTEIYNWDGAYFFDKARGAFGVSVKNFTVNNSSVDPTALPGFPDELGPYFGYGRGGIRFLGRIPVDPHCVEKAQQARPFRPAFGA